LNSYAIAQTIVIVIGVAAAIVSLVTYALTWGTGIMFFIDATLTLAYVALCGYQLYVAWDDYYKARDAADEYNKIINSEEYKNIKDHVNDLKHTDTLLATWIGNALTALNIIFTYVITPWYYAKTKFYVVMNSSKPQWVKPTGLIAAIISGASAIVSTILYYIYENELRNDYEGLRNLEDELDNIWSFLI
jgi:hypothetical protein